MLLNIVNAELCECNSCKDCTEKLNSISCTEVRLIKNIEINQSDALIDTPWMKPRHCISIFNIESKIFDCQGKEIKLVQLPLIN